MKPYLFLLVVLYACSHTQEKNDRWIHEAGTLITSAPDSALVLLHKVDSTRLDAGQYAEYILLKVQAKDKTDKGITYDTAIFRARDYFAAHTDNKKKVLACYYAGRVYQERDSAQAAMRAFLEADRVAQLLKDEDHLKGAINYKIGDLYYDNEQIDNAISHYRLAAGYLHRSAQDTKEMYALNAIGTSFLISEKFDSALYYFNKVSEMSTYTDDNRIQSSIMRNIGLVFRCTGDFDKARRLFLQALGQNSDEHVKAHLYICLSQVYQGLQQPDSASFFIERALQLCEQMPKPPMASIYKTIVGIEESKGNYKGALDYAQKQTAYERNIHKQYQDRQLLEAERKYNYELEQNKNYQLLIRQNEERFWFSCLLTACLAVAGCLLIFYIRSRKLLVRKNKDIETLKQETDGHKQQIAMLKETIAHEQETIRQLELDKTAGKTGADKDIDAKIKAKEEHIGLLEAQIRQSYTYTLQAHLLVYKKYDKFKLTLLPKEHKNTIDEFDRYFYGETRKINWDTICPLIPEKLEENIKKQYGELNSNEVRICCLLLFNVSYTDIAVILHVTSESAHSIAHRARKKTGITDIPVEFGHLLYR